MAQIQFGDILEVNFTNSLRATASLGGSGGQLADPSNYSNITNLDAALKAFDATTYSDAKLQGMNTNDKIFALRNVEDPTTIADYVTAQKSRTA